MTRGRMNFITVELELHVPMCTWVGRYILAWFGRNKYNYKNPPTVFGLN